MKKRSSLVFALILIASLTSCSDNAAFKVTTYTISRSGEIYTDEYFDVIHVYGFADNSEVARQIVEFLNQQEPDTYIYHPAN